MKVRKKQTNKIVWREKISKKEKKKERKKEMMLE